MTPCNRTSGTIHSSGSLARNNGDRDHSVRKAAFTIFQCKAVLDSDRRLMAGSNMGHSVVNRTLAHLDPAHLDLAGVRNRWDGVSSSGADNSASFHNRT